MNEPGVIIIPLKGDARTELAPRRLQFVLASAMHAGAFVLVGALAPIVGLSRS